MFALILAGVCAAIVGLPTLFALSLVWLDNRPVQPPVDQ